MTAEGCFDTAASFSELSEGVGGEGLAKAISAEKASPSDEVVEIDFCRAFVRVSVSLAKTSAIQASPNCGRNIHGCSIAIKLSNAIEEKQLDLNFELQTGFNHGMKQLDLKSE